MVFRRYDHRKLAFRQKASGAKKKRTFDGEEDKLNALPRKSIDHGGYLGMGKGKRAALTLKHNNEPEMMMMPAKVENNGRPTVQFASHASPEPGDDFASHATRRQSMFPGHDHHSSGEAFSGDGDDFDVLNNMMLHMDEKKKNRERQQMEEEFDEIKERYVFISLLLSYLRSCLSAVSILRISKEILKCFECSKKVKY